MTADQVLAVIWWTLFAIVVGLLGIGLRNVWRNRGVR
jgi:hypothetical protein